ncbi:MAG: UTP--glucose-1-phosphate uridylyltransferase [Chlamydiae bacterium]|nr:UTP--glucose-1-phosphate uridylyltransferase [Chlamydiota bacterium]
MAFALQDHQIQVEELALLNEKMLSCTSIQKKLTILRENPKVDFFLEENPMVDDLLVGMNKKKQLVVLSLIVIDQGERILKPLELQREVWLKPFHKMVQDLLVVESFYRSLGGIIGYHCITLQLMKEKDKLLQTDCTYHPFQGIDITKKNKKISKYLIQAIKELDQIAEIYPVGGAADRLQLFDVKTKLPLPAARLLFLGKTLIERLVCDLQAREYLHYKIYKKQIAIPLAMMTSNEKDNHAQIISIFEENNWFNRPKNLFYFFPQPLVPSMNSQGEWCLTGPMQLLLKPGGHGVIWKLALEKGIFSWFENMGCRKALIRQINNLASSLDYGILALMGIGFEKGKVLGFASCPREIKTSEGMNVLVERKKKGEREYFLTNIEYCNFKKYNISDEPVTGTNFSRFTSNTNILFIDLKTAKHIAKNHPFPGMLVNSKRVKYFDWQGNSQEEEIVRLESTMQNIGDYVVHSIKKPLVSKNQPVLKTFLTHNFRHKTISPLKREYVNGNSLRETPEGCHMDLLKNGRELLKEHCKMEVPDLASHEIYLRKGPSFLFSYHPALGPLYSIIAQKIKGGRLAIGSELQLEIADLFLENPKVEGTLLIQAKNVMGNLENGILTYSEDTGKCFLKNVSIKNRGVDWNHPNVFWKNEVKRKEACKIHLFGNGEFYAENVVFEGNMEIKVASGKKVTAKMKKGKVVFEEEPLKKPSLSWDYSIDSAYEIKVEIK